MMRWGACAAMSPSRLRYHAQTLRMIQYDMRVQAFLLPVVIVSWGIVTAEVAQWYPRRRRNQTIASRP